jgi:hypothetical protein
MRLLLLLALGLVAPLGAWPAWGAPPKGAPPKGAPPKESAPAKPGSVGPATAAPALPVLLGGELATITVGSWAEYAVADLARKTTLRLRLAVVERTDAGTWTELTLTMPGVDRLIIKCLVKGDSRKPESTRRVILRAGNLQAVEVVGGAPAEAAPRYQAVGGSSSKRLGIETVRVPAGAVPAEHHRIVTKEEVADSWTSTKVPLFGLVKFKGKLLIMELSGSGTDARSQISGRVGKLDIAAMRGMVPGSQPSK